MGPESQAYKHRGRRQVGLSLLNCTESTAGFLQQLGFADPSDTPFMLLAARRVRSLPHTTRCRRTPPPPWCRRYTPQPRLGMEYFFATGPRKRACAGGQPLPSVSSHRLTVVPANQEHDAKLRFHSRVPLSTDSGQQACSGGSQRTRQFDDVEQAHIPLAPLDSANIRPVQVCFFSQACLRKLERKALSSDGCSELRAGIGFHALMVNQ